MDRTGVYRLYQTCFRQSRTHSGILVRVCEEWPCVGQYKVGLKLKSRYKANTASEICQPNSLATLSLEYDLVEMQDKILQRPYVVLAFMRKLERELVEQLVPKIQLCRFHSKNRHWNK